MGLSGEFTPARLTAFGRASGVCVGIVRGQRGFDFAITLDDLALIVLPALQRLAQCEEVLSAPSATQRLLDLLSLGAADLPVALGEQGLGRTFSGNDWRRMTARRLKPASEG